MSYFNLRKRADEPEPEEVEEQEPASEEESEESVEEKQPAKQHGPLLTGLFGPGRWITARFNRDTAIFVQVASLFSVLYYGGWIAAGVVLAWLLAVLLFIPREVLERWAAAIEGRSRSEKRAEPEAEKSPKAAPEAVRSATIEWVQRQVGDTQGVHLRDLLQHAQQHGMFEDLDVTTFRVHLGRWGIPVRSRVRVRGKGVTVGIHRDDLKPLPSTPSPPPSQDPPNPGLHVA
ncbi:MAG TPA: hypothetical protein VI172_01630 [Candidatus Dormibacteraeota bacterium]|jgi:hypothetical protein